MQQLCKQFRRDLRIARGHVLGLIIRDDLRENVIRILGERPLAAAPGLVGVRLGPGVVGGLVGRGWGLGACSF